MAGLGVLAAACAGTSESLVERINVYRASPQMCAGKPTRATGPLAPAPVLAKVNLASAQASLLDALKRVGYTAAQAEVIVVGGPFTESAAMAVLAERYCEVLASPQFSEIGVSRDGRTWVVVLAQPLFSSDLGDWREAGRAVLELVNRARAAPRSCGERRFGPAAPIEWNAKLAAAALAHSEDMARGSYVAHASRDGSLAGDRAARAGYDWQRIGENIAGGLGSPEKVVAGWLASPGHCSNIMQPDFTEMGAAYALNPASDTIIYWTQVFGASQR